MRASKAQTVEFFDVRDPVLLRDETSSFLHEGLNLAIGHLRQRTPIGSAWLAISTASLMVG